VVVVAYVRESKCKVVWEGVAQHFSPFDNQNAAGRSRTIKIEVVKLGSSLKSVDVGMADGERASTVFVHQRKGRRRHGITDSEFGTQRLCEHRLARTEIA
jgi:hypothetical protein